MAIATDELRTALANANMAPRLKLWAPGSVTTITPTNPTMSADQRCSLTFSLRMTIDSSVVNSGAAKLIATAEPSDIMLNAKNMQVIEPNCDTPRCKCPKYRWVRNTAIPVFGMIITATVTSAKTA